MMERKLSMLDGARVAAVAMWRSPRFTHASAARARLLKSKMLEGGHFCHG
jgi:hypothetical protein